MHTCPDCGQACSCAGDIEDHDTGEEYLHECQHHKQCMGDDDEDPWLDDEPPAPANVANGDGPQG